MFEPLKRITGIAAPWPAHNTDTDVIMPKRFLRTITRAGLADGLFADLRFDADGAEHTAFVLNCPPWRDAAILVVGDNFGCGSSREHAVWGLQQFGFRVLVGTGFAGIFYDNCRRNGVAAITIDGAARDLLMKAAADPERAAMTVDLEQQCIAYAGGRVTFALPDAIRDDLMAGRDAITATLAHADTIRAFEADYWADAR
jgi:3-isopropylmalate/(R)-2-methylmalate dehydratase small subunit